MPSESCELLQEGIPPVKCEPEHSSWKPSEAVSCALFYNIDIGDVRSNTFL